MTIILPRNLDFMSEVEFCKKMWELEEDDEYLFHFVIFLIPILDLIYNYLYYLK